MIEPVPTRPEPTPTPRPDREPPGADCVLLNDRDEVLLVLRDAKPTIPFPDTWALLGGYLEAGETPVEALLREVQEEIGVQLPTPQFFRTYHWPECSEHIFWQRLELDPAQVDLTEGQRLAWFARDALAGLPFASHYGQILDEFFACSPHRGTDSSVGPAAG